MIMQVLGTLYLNMSEYQKARELLEEALAIEENYYGTRKHQDTAIIIKELGLVYIHEHKYDQAKQLLEEALTTQEMLYGSSHIEIASTLTYLAQLASTTGKNKHALSLVERAINILQNHPGLSLEHIYLKKANEVKKMILGM